MNEILVEGFHIFVIKQADCHFENLVGLSCEDKRVLARR